MRQTGDGYECARHGAPLPELPPVASNETAAIGPAARRKTVTRTSPRPTRVRLSKPRDPTVQTQRQTAMLDSIIERNRGGESIAAIASDIWRDLRYANEYVCASKISYFLRRRGVKVAAVRPGPSPGARSESRFTMERLAEVRTAVESGVTVWAFAGSHWQEWGFPSRVACDSLIRKWMRTKSAEAA